MQLRWSHAVIKVRNMETMTRFYMDVLGFEVADRGPLFGDSGPEIVFMSQYEGDHHQIAFVEAREDEGPSNSVDHIAFRVDGLADVREMMDRVATCPDVDAGAPVTHGNAISVYFKDPEQNGIEVFCDTPWHVQQPVIAPWDPSLDDADVLKGVGDTFAQKPGTGPMADYIGDRATHFAGRTSK